jgi:uncharacterized membrane protein
MDQVLESQRRASSPAADPRVRRVPATRPIEWLRLGARDLARSPGPSLAIGIVVAIVGAFLVAASWKAAYLAPALLGGFLLVAPFIAIGVYTLSRQLEQNRRPEAAQAWRDARANGSSIALFGLILALAYLVWERIAAIVFALFYGGQALHASHWGLELLSPAFAGLLTAFFAAGAALAAGVFVLGVVSAPLLLDRPVDVITAVVTSVRCCVRNPGAMVLWALLIAGLTALGFATAMLGLVVVFPWLAHASWHAYRDLVD